MYFPKVTLRGPGSPASPSTSSPSSNPDTVRSTSQPTQHGDDRDEGLLL